ncbi:MAG TPA: hypothetical protein VKH42_15295 [Vicinamibacterales bacterium]|nr:hypothetical protein [Vicinamibacterales bacterium]
MLRFALFIVLLGVTTTAQMKRPGTVKDLTFLTRDGCVNTPDMVNSLDDALTGLGWPKDYLYIAIGRLKKSDKRTGYPTPTLLWMGKDIFGMPAPKPPFDAPS